MQGVMMDWEAPLMKRHAEIICEGRGDVLNIGFGMGIVDGCIAELQVRAGRACRYAAVGGAPALCACSLLLAPALP